MLLEEGLLLYDQRQRFEKKMMKGQIRLQLCHVMIDAYARPPQVGLGPVIVLSLRSPRGEVRYVQQVEQCVVRQGNHDDCLSLWY